MPISNIEEFINGPVSKGVSLTNAYVLTIVNDIIDPKQDENVMLLCRDINWPSYSLNLGSVNNVVLGANEQRYPFSDITNELEATFMVDSQGRTLRYFSDWFKLIFKTQVTSDNGLVKRFNYPNEYTTTAYLSKHENHGTQGLVNGAIKFTGFYPYIREISPLSYSKTDVMDITVRFSFDSQYEVYHKE